MEAEKKNLIPSAVVVMFLVVGGAFVLGKIDISKENKKDNTEDSAITQQLELLKGMRPISAEDHILGNPNAPIKIIEYSDFECPFCKTFHQTMNQIVKEYGAGGQVAWVYRHFPLDNIHSKADKEAEASECAAELGGNEAFWAYTEKIFEVTPSNNGLDPAFLPQIAKEIGLNQEKFKECLNSGKYTAKVEADYQNGLSIGVEGTPFSVIALSSGKMFPIEGSQPYEQIKGIVELFLQQIAPAGSTIPLGTTTEE